MRRVVYCTKRIKTPKFFANMCNIVGTEKISSMEFADFVKDRHGVELEDISDAEYDDYFEEYRQYVSNEAESSEVVEISDIQTDGVALDVDLEADIDMKSDGSWDFLDTSWAQCAETEDGSWYSSDDVLITTSKDLVEDVDSLLQLYLPIQKGTFHVTGNIHLTYDVNDGVSQFDIANSKVENFISDEVH